MRITLILLSWLMAAQAVFAADDDLQFVKVDDPYIELHTGPGRGFPIFYVAERHEEVAVLKRRTDWFKIRLRKGQEGWVALKQFQRTLTLLGQPLELNIEGLDDFVDRRWEMGAAYGDFAGANLLHLYGAFQFTENLSLELRATEALGNFSNSVLGNINLVHQPFPEWRYSPYFTIGAGQIFTNPSATLVQTEDRSDYALNVGVGAKIYVTRRFIFRLEARNYAIITSRDDIEDINEWTAGFSVFF